MAITTGNHPKALWEGVYEWWGQDYNEHPVQWTDLVDTATSKKNREELVQSTSFGLAPKKSQGGGITYDTNNQGYTNTAVHTVYGIGYIVTEEEEDDNLYTEVSMKRVTSANFSVRQTKENVVANIYNRAFNSSYTYGDASELCVATHANSVGGGTSSNIITAAALSEASIEDMLTAIMGATNDRGLKIGLIGECLVVPRQLHWEAYRILNSVLQNDTANNADNVLRSTGALPKGIKTNVYLSDSNNWFVRTNAPSGLRLFQRKPVEFKTDNDFNTGNMLAKVQERYSVSFGDFRTLFGSAPA